MARRKRGYIGNYVGNVGKGNHEIESFKVTL